MKKVYLIGLLSIIISLSCEKDVVSDKSVQNGFADIQAASILDTLSATKIHQLSNDLTLVNSFEIENVNDSYLVISEQRSDNFINVFELPTVDHRYSFGTVSQGPEVDEFLGIPVFLDSDQDHLIIHDSFARTLRFIDLDGNTHDKINEISLSYDGQLEPLNRVRMLDENLYFADYGTSFEQTDREFVALQPNNSDTLFTFGRYPASEFGIYPEDISEGIRRYDRFTKGNLSNPDGTRFAAFYFRHNMFKIFNQRGEELVAVNINDSLLGDDLPDDFMFRTTGWASNDYIYTLGLNGSWSELTDNPEPDENRTTTFEVWDWNGESIYRAHFDRLITNYTVSEVNGKIYGLSASVQNVIFEFEIPEFDIDR